MMKVPPYFLEINRMQFHSLCSLLSWGCRFSLFVLNLPFSVVRNGHDWSHHHYQLPLRVLIPAVYPLSKTSKWTYFYRFIWREHDNIYEKYQCKICYILNPRTYQLWTLNNYWHQTHFGEHLNPFHVQDSNMVSRWWPMARRCNGVSWAESVR